MARTRNVALLLLVFAFGLPAWAHHAPDGPIKVHAEGATKDPVTFDHPKHFAGEPELQQNCKRCHHQVENTDAMKNEASWKCTACHTTEGKGDAPEVKEAMHGKDSGVCRECHFGSSAVKRLKCGDCHSGD